MLHRRYEVYAKALAAVRGVAEIVGRFPPGHAWLADQLRRAVASAPLNIAEGLGRTSRPDRERFFAIARASLTEADAALDVAVALGVVTPVQAQPTRELILGSVQMLWKLRSPPRVFPAAR